MSRRGSERRFEYCRITGLVTQRSLHFRTGSGRITTVELDIAPTVCRYDGCILGPDGGPAPLVQPLRGGNIREYCSDRHRIAAHRARQRRPLPGPTPRLAGSTSPDRAGGAPSLVAANLTALAADLGRLAAEVERALAVADADRVARELQDARLRVAEAEARAAATAAERDREQAAAAGFREMAEKHLTAAERAGTRADGAEAALDAAREAMAAAESARDEARAAQGSAEARLAVLESDLSAAVGQAAAAESALSTAEGRAAAAEELVAAAERRADEGAAARSSAEERLRLEAAARLEAEGRAKDAERRARAGPKAAGSAGGGGEGEAESEAAAETEAAVAPEATAHELGQAPAGIEAEAGAAAGRGAVEGVEALEEAGDVAGEDAGADVDDGHLEGLASVGDLHGDRAVGIAEGVVDQRVDHPLQEPPVGHDVEPGGARHRQVALGVGDPVGADHHLDGGPQVEPSGPDGHRGG